MAHHGRDVGIAPALYCYGHAVDAVVPTVEVGLAIGCATGAFFAWVLSRRKRRFDDALREVAVRPRVQ